MALAFGLAMPRAHGDVADEYELKSAFVYKFAQFTAWPAEPPLREFNLCLLGGNPFEGALEKFQGKSLKEVTVKFKHAASAEAARGCQLVFLNPSSSGELTQWVATLQALPILTVSDHPDAFRKNVIIVLSVEPNRVAFSVNATAARAAGLSLSSQMLQLAREVR